MCCYFPKPNGRNCFRIRLKRCRKRQPASYTFVLSTPSSRKILWPLMWKRLNSPTTYQPNWQETGSLQIILPQDLMEFVKTPSSQRCCFCSSVYLVQQWQSFLPCWSYNRVRKGVSESCHCFRFAE